MQTHEGQEVMRIFVDADACPVKDETLKVAFRHHLPVVFVGNSWMRGYDDPLITQIVVPQGADAADDRIVEEATPGDVVVTADIRLAARILEKKARAVDHRGKLFDEASIGMAVAMRDLTASLRETGELTGGPRPYAKQDRSRFLDGLEQAVQAAKRGRA